MAFVHAAAEVLTHSAIPCRTTVDEGAGVDEGWGLAESDGADVSGVADAGAFERNGEGVTEAGVGDPIGLGSIPADPPPPDRGETTVNAMIATAISRRPIGSLRSDGPPGSGE